MYQKYGKRLFDITTSAITLLLLSPLLLWLVLKIKKNLGSPVIFSQIRPGKNNKLFRLYKFRSMTDARDAEGNLLSDEERMTDFGRKLRATSLDELPELWNILIGDMSVVGPRPQLVRDMVFFNEEEMHRQDVTPGLTGLAQINGRNNSSWKDRFAYDLAYIRKITFCEDVRIIWRTIFKVSKQEDITTDGMETSEDYGDWLLRQNMVNQAEYQDRQMHSIKILNEYMEDKIMSNGWKYYKHALLPTSAPHENVDTEKIKNGKIWRGKWKGTPLFARWTSNWDCGKETQWWYCLKDTSFDIEKIKAKYRYYIRKGERNFNVIRINPLECVDDLFEVQKRAFSAYPITYRPRSIIKERVTAEIIKNHQNGLIYYGAYGRDDGCLYGFSIVRYKKDYAELLVQKTDPKAEKKQINAALVYGCLNDMKNLFDGDFYLLDGERNVNHITGFQDYLIRYFGFRRAYCKLHITYRPLLKPIIYVIYPIRKVIKAFDSNRIIHKVNAILKMEEISREDTVLKN